MSNQWPSASGSGPETDPIAEADLAAHVAAADPHPGYQKESEKAQADGYASLDGSGQVPSGQLGNASGGAADASTTVKGVSKLSTAPVSPTDPIAAGDNDPRLSDQRTPTDASVTAAKVNGALKPSGSAASTDESLRRLGTGATHAAAGDDSRFPSTGEKNALAGTSGTPGTANKYVTDGDARNSDTRTPTDGSVTAAKVAASLKPSGSAAAGTEALRALGTSASTAAAGNDGRLSDARTPTAHASSHGSGGSDPVTLAESQVTGLVADLALKAPLASPALTGSPTVPDQTTGDNTTKAANTKFVQTASGLLVPKSLFTAKGSIVTATGSGVPVEKAAGANRRVLRANSAQSDGLEWADMAEYDVDFGYPGIWLPQGIPCTVTTGVLTNNRIFIYRFRPSRNMTLTGMAFAVTTAGNALDVVDVGVLTFAGTAGTRLASSGSVTFTANVSEAKNVNFTSTLDVVAGTVYYAAIGFTFQAASTTQIGAVSIGANAILSELMGANTPLIPISFVAAAPPIAANPTSAGRVTTAAHCAVRTA